MTGTLRCLSINMWSENTQEIWTPSSAVGPYEFYWLWVIEIQAKFSSSYLFNHNLFFPPQHDSAKQAASPFHSTGASMMIFYLQDPKHSHPEA